MAVITISRQYGSGGDEIAFQVRQLLGYELFDKRLMMRMAAEIGLPENEVVDLSEDDYKVRGFLERMLRRPDIQRIRPDVETWARGSEGAAAPVWEGADEAKIISLVHRRRWSSQHARVPPRASPTAVPRGWA